MRDALLPNEGPPEHERWQKQGVTNPDENYKSLPGSGLPSTGQAAVDDEEELPTADKLFAIAKAADDLSNKSDLTKRRAAHARSWRAFHNEHPDGSRYRHENYANRSKLFFPKTHSAVIDNCVAFAQALFSTNDVVSVTAERAADPRQSASAAVIQAVLNIRLDRTSHKSGIPWFHLSVAACQEAQVVGVTISKQYWQYEYLTDVFEVPVDPMRPDPVVVGMDGQPVQKISKKRVLYDRFIIEPHAAENVIVDTAAPFYEVIQGGAFLIVKHPMHVGDVRTMMKPGRQRMGGGTWFNVSDDVLLGLARDYNNAAVRIARDKGSDRYSSQNSARLNDLQIVWVHENFVRHNGRDYQFWSLGTQRLLSEPIETIEAYPALHGERPYVMGLAAIEPHNALPMSPVELWRPLQDATNDIGNLGIDTIRQTISPIKKVVRGRKVDLKQLRRMGPDATVMVQEADDVTFETMPNNAEAAFAQLDRLAVYQDELSGKFSTSSVQSNRNLNETVGGMKLLSGAATGKTEFNLRVFVETWAEPVIRHCVWNIQYYETDERLLALAGDKAKLTQKYPGADPLEMDLLECEATVRVNLGIGAADPMQRMTKLGGGLKMLEDMAATGVFAGQVTAKAKEIFDEVLGLCGYPESERFFDFKTPEEASQNQPPSAEELKAKEIELKGQQLQADAADKQANTELKKQELAQRDAEFHAGLRTTALDHHAQMTQQDMEARRIALEHFHQQQQGDREDQRSQQDFGLRQQESAQAAQSAQQDFGLRQQESQQAAEAGQQDLQLRAQDQQGKQAVAQEGLRQQGEAQQQQGQIAQTDQIMQFLQMMADNMQKIADRQAQQEEAIASREAEQTTLIKQLSAQKEIAKQRVRQGMQRSAAKPKSGA